MPPSFPELIGNETPTEKLYQGNNIGWSIPFPATSLEGQQVKEEISQGVNFHGKLILTFLNA